MPGGKSTDSRYQSSHGNRGKFPRRGSNHWFLTPPIIPKLVWLGSSLFSYTPPPINTSADPKLTLFLALMPFLRTNSRRQIATLAVWSVVLVALLASPGCVRRRLTVRTSPPGAQVFVDNQEVGTSPVSTSFVYYGTRKIQLIKDGFETQTLYEKIWPPWYELPPLEFVSENLWPGEIRDERAIDVQLVPMQIVPEQQLLDRADSLRDGIRAGQITSLPGAASGFTQPNAGTAATTAPGNQPLFGFPGQGLNGNPATNSNKLLQPATETSRSNWRRMLQIF
jgi:hypothetical protein